MSAFTEITSQQPRAADGLRRCLVQATLVAVALVWSISFLSFLDVKEATLWGGTAVLACLNAAAGRNCVAGFRALAPCWITLACALILALFRAPVPWFSFLEVLRIAPVLLFTSLAYDQLRHPADALNVMRAIVAAGTGAALLALMQYADLIPNLFPRFDGYDQAMYSVFGNEGLLGGYLATGIVCLAGVYAGIDTGVGRRRARLFAMAIGATLIAALLLSASRGALVALISGGLALVYFRVLTPRGAAVSLFGVILLAALVFTLLDVGPWLRWTGTLGSEDVGGNLRPWIWAGSLRLLLEHPLLGIGIGNFAYAIPLPLGEVALAHGTGVNTLTTYHAHMDVLEWLCETGLAGLGLLVWLGTRIRARNPAALCALIALTTFSFFHPAWHSAPHALAGLMLYAMCIEAKEDVYEGGSWPRALRAVSIVAAFAGGLVFIYVVLQPSFLLCRAEDLHLAGLPAEAAYQDASTAAGFHPEAHESFGIYALEQDDVARARLEFERAKAGLDTGRIYRLLAMAAEAAGDWEAACGLYQQCAARWPWDEAIQLRITRLCGEQVGR